MKSKLSYKTKRNIIIVAIILALLAIISTATYFFIQGNDDASAFSQNNMQIDENEGRGQSEEQTGNEGEATQEGENSDNSQQVNQEGENTTSSDETATDENSNGTEGETSTTTNNVTSTGTSNVATGEVPNQDYVTERIEYEDELTQENYKVEWWNLDMKATTTTANLSIIRPIISQAKVADKTAVVENEIITYTISVINSGTDDGRALVKDIMPMTSDLVDFVDGSIEINGTDTIKVGDNEIEVNAEEIAKLTAEDLQNGIEVNVPKKVEEDTTVINGLVTISFKVQVKEGATGTVTNKAEVNDEETDLVEIPIITYSKSVDRETLTLDENNNIVDGNELEYTITVINSEQTAGSVTIKDTAPEGTTFKANSIKIAGTDKVKVAGQEIEVSAEELAKLTATDLTNGIEVEVPAEGTSTLKFKVTVTDTTATIKNTGFVNEQETNETETKLVGNIVFIEHGGSDVDDMSGFAGEEIENRNMPVTNRLGYQFAGWYTQEAEGEQVNELPQEYIAGTIYYHAQWIANEDTIYTVKYYYQNNGKYPELANKTITRTGTTDTTARVKDTDMDSELASHVFDDDAENVLYGNINANGTLVLKVYFKQQYTVVYKPGEKGTFSEQSTDELDYNTITPAFKGETTGEAGYIFAGWSPELADKVTEDAIYVAQWKGLQVNKDRTGVLDEDGVNDLPYAEQFVDQAGDRIKYNITVTNTGTVSVSGIELTDKYDVTVTSIKKVDNDSEKETISDTATLVEKDTNLLEGTNIELQPGESIVVTITQEVTPTDLDSALEDDASTIENVATATLNDIEYTDEEETDVKNRYQYTIEYRYNGKDYYYDETNQKKDAEVLSDDAVEGTLITISKETHYPDTKNGYQYIEYEVLMPEGKITADEETNKIIIYYGKPDVTISKSAPATVNAGDEFEYTITVRNSGHIGATVTVTDTLPSTTTYVKAVEESIEATTTDKQNLSWNIDLVANSTETIKFKVKLDNDTVDSEFTNTAKVTYTYAGKEITKTSGDEETQVNGVTVNYNELKIGQTLDDINVIFVLDNSSSMNYPAEGKAFANPDVIVDGGSFDESTRYHIAPGDEDQTRLYAAQQAINGFIDEFPSADISVITFNTKENETKNLIQLVNSKGEETAKYNGINYNVEEQYMSTNSKEYDGIKIPLACGAIDRGSATANNTASREALKARVSDISITSARGGLGTFICPALDMIKENQGTYLSATKKNVVIIIADGVFEDEKDETNAGIIASTRTNLRETAKDNKKELEIFSVALGDSSHFEFDADALKALSTNNSCVTAGNTNTLLNKFKEIHSEATDNTDTKNSVNGTVTIGEASKNIIVPGTSTVEGLDDSIKVTYMNGEEEETLFECTSSTQLSDFGLSIVGKNIYWDVNEYIRQQNIKLPSRVFNLKYYIPLN